MAASDNGLIRQDVPERPVLVDGGPGADNRFSRRKFLTGLGLMAALGAVGSLPRLGRLSGRAVRLERSRAGLGTWIRIVARDEGGARAERAISRAFAAIDRVDAQMSIHRADSELSRVNAMAGREAVAVSAALRDVVARARRAALATDGVYDPTVLPLMRLYGFYGSGRTHMPGDNDIARTLACMGAREIVIDDAAGTVGLTRRGAALDLGSIGKGWAADRAADALRAEGIRSGLVDVGRNVVAFGTPDDDVEGWRVGVLEPETGAVTNVLTLRDASVATSSNAEQWRWLDGVRVGHLLDAHAGRPAHARRSATVVARTGTAADTGSTLAFLLGPAGVACLPEVSRVELLA